MEKLKMSLRVKIQIPFLLGIGNAVFLVLFIKIFGGHSTDQSSQDDKRHQIRKSHEGVGHISYVPDNIQMNPLDDRTDKQQRDECDSERKDDFDTEYVFQAFLPIVTPSEQCGITKKKRAYRDDVPPEW